MTRKETRKRTIIKRIHCDRMRGDLSYIEPIAVKGSIHFTKAQASKTLPGFSLTNPIFFTNIMNY